MKRIVFISIIILFSCYFVSCDSKRVHTHNWKSTYSYNKEYHWQMCDGCNDQNNKELHIFVNDVCEVCTYSKQYTKDLAYEINPDNTGYILTGIGTSNANQLIIPDEYNNLPVISIKSIAFEGCVNLTSVKIPTSVTSIGEKAFLGCSGLITVEIPLSVTNMETDVFSGCSNLTIYCEVSIEPNGWSPSWNSTNRPVIWGYKK